MQLGSYGVTRTLLQNVGSCGRIMQTAVLVSRFTRKTGKAAFLRGLRGPR